MMVRQPVEQGSLTMERWSCAALRRHFLVVFLIGMNEGTFPDYRARGSALEEERRSAFVAVTHSKAALCHVSQHKSNALGMGSRESTAAFAVCLGSIRVGV